MIVGRSRGPTGAVASSAGFRDGQRSPPGVGLAAGRLRRGAAPTAKGDRRARAAMIGECAPSAPRTSGSPASPSSASAAPLSPPRSPSCARCARERPDVQESHVAVPQVQERGVPEPPGPSRSSLEGAGWGCRTRGVGAGLAPVDSRFSWLRPGPLIASRNDVLVRWFGDPTDEQRREWLRRLDEYARAAGEPPPPRDRLISRYADRDRIAVAVLGDPGEGDASQYVVVPVLERVAGDTDFAVLCSDVVYPAGGVRAYADRFYRPYADYPRPDLRAARQPRLVRRARRLHDHLLRRAARRGRPVARRDRAAVAAADAPPALAAGAEGDGRGRRRHALVPRRRVAAGRPARAVLRDRRRAGAAGADRHRPRRAHRQ